jgi:hypothetical protein
MNRNDVRMPDHGCGAGLPAEAFNTSSFANELLVEHLDGHFIADMEAASAVNCAHPAFSQASDEFILRVEHPAYKRVSCSRVYSSDQLVSDLSISIGLSGWQATAAAEMCIFV